MRMILLGPPGSGKGTLASELCKLFPFIHVSTGELFRNHIREGTPLGQKISSYLEKGELVPDDLTIQLVETILQEKKVLQNFLLDGFPRTLPQAQIFDDCLQRYQVELDYALYVQVPDETIRSRLTGRRVCKHCGATYHICNYPPKEEGICDHCGQGLVQRKDDQPEVIDKRLKTYHELTAPLVAYYEAEGKLIEIDNSGAIEDVVAALRIRLKRDEL